VAVCLGHDDPDGFLGLTHSHLIGVIGSRWSTASVVVGSRVAWNAMRGWLGVCPGCGGLVYTTNLSEVLDFDKILLFDSFPIHIPTDVAVRSQQ
jgi:hypothetical protein